MHDLYSNSRGGTVKMHDLNKIFPLSIWRNIQYTVIVFLFGMKQTWNLTVWHYKLFKKA
jgi:hypothetical protein